MAGIIDLLKARKARSAAMLNPGRKSGSGSGLLLNSSSLQPQTVFRQTKASFSVKRPSMTLLNTNAMSSFSEKAEMKYTSGPSLLHLKPASSAPSSAPSVQRAPASMPLPLSGGSVPAQSAGDNSAVSSGAAVSSGPAYPPKSERRPVVFDRSDGPSDFEKRLMAAKKQKADQEAKQRGPDRRRVRTERVEISPGSSNEIQREILDTNSESLFQRINRKVQQAAGNSGPHSEPEKKEPRRTEPQPARQTSVSASENTVQRESDGSEPAVKAEPDAGPSFTREVQRETLPEVGNQPRNISAEGVPAHSAERVRQARPSVQSTGAADVTVQREPLKTAAPVEKPSDKAEKPAVPASVSTETIQREPLKTAAPVEKTAEKAEKPAAPAPLSTETVQREPLKKAAPVEKPAEKAEKPAAPATVTAETVQREPLKTDAPAEKPAEKAEKPAAPVSVSAETVQREPLKTAAPVEKPEKAEKPAAPASAETVQREPLKTAAPVEKPAEKAEKPAAPAPVSAETVQREPLKTAAPVEKPEKTEKPAVPVSVSTETVQREPLKTAAPVEKPAEKAEKPAVPASVFAETVQREPLKTAAPVEKPEKTEKPAVPTSVSAETIQREPLKTAAPVEKPAEKAEKPAVPASVSAETVQREPLKTASPVEKPEKTEKPAVPASVSAETVQREPLKKAAPVEKPAEKAEKPAVPASVSAETVQREPLKTASLIEKTEKTEKPAVPASVSAETIQREPLKTAAPVEKPEKAGKPVVPSSVSAEIVQREPLKTAAPVEKPAEKAEKPVVPSSVSAETVQREPLKTAAPVEKPAEKAEKPAAPASVSAETIQREPLKTAAPVEKVSEKTEKPAAPESASVETVQREVLETAEPLVQVNKTSEMPLPNHSESPAESAATVARELDVNVPAAKEQTQAQNRISPAKAVPVKPSNLEKPHPAAAVVQRSFAPDKPDDNAAEKDPADGVIWREMHQKRAEPAEKKSPEVPTVEREPDEDLQSLLNRLPKHYEMPQAQIDAIRSGKPYSAKQTSNPAGQDSVIRREPADEPVRSKTNNAERKQRPAGQPAEAVVRNSVQREPDLVLPKKQNSGDSVSEKTEPVIQREIDRNSEKTGNPVSDSGKRPVSAGTPQVSFGQNGFMGSGSGPSVNQFPGVQPGLVQREPLDSFEPDTIQREPLNEIEKENDTSSALQEVKDDIEEARVPVTARQLDSLADKLVPRIKRLMRAEMERSVFR